VATTTTPTAVGDFTNFLLIAISIDSIRISWSTLARSYTTLLGHLVKHIFILIGVDGVWIPGAALFPRGRTGVSGRAGN
jgi:hypothetical protein